MSFIFLKGVFKVKSIHHSDDYLVAGRSVRWFLLFATMGATIIGGGYSIGAVGKTYELGLVWVFVFAGAYFHFIFSGLVVAPQFREAKLYTVAGYFGYRFGENPRFLALILSILFSIFIVAAQMAAFGTVLSTIMPQFADNVTVLRWAIFIGGMMVIIYSTAGGLLAVMHTDIYQFVVLFVGFVLTLVLCLPDILGSWGEITTKIRPEFFQVEGGKGWLFLITTFLAFFVGETFGPAYVTRYCVGTNIRETKMGIAGVGIFLGLTFPVILFFIALYARIHFPEIDSQQALPMVIQRLNHPIVAGLIIAALLSAVMSSADSALNSATAIFVKDLFEHQLGWTKKGDKYLLKLARICTAILGITAMLVAIILPDIIGLLLFTYHIWAPAIILPVVVGAISKKRSPELTKRIFITMLISILSTFIYMTTPWADTFDPAVFGVLVSVVVFFSTNLIYRGSNDSEK
ncbi:sodium:solute symporter family protein [bacterium]|nr:sodium:solute symporter family protein [bacterium]